MPGEMDSDISSIIFQLACSEEKHIYQSRLQELLITKRKRFSAEADYMGNLIESIAFLAESQNTVFDLIYHIFGNKVYTLSPSQHMRLLEEAQSNIKQNLIELKGIYSALHNQQMTNHENIAVLEMKYVVNKFSYDMASDLLISLCNPENKSNFLPLYQYPAAEMITNLRSEIEYYSKMYNENISFEVKI